MTKRANQNYHNKLYFPDTHPNLISFYSPENSVPINQVKAGSHEKRLWVGKCGHTFERRVQYFIKSQSCSVCNNSQVRVGVNDLNTTHKDFVSNYWSPNNTISPESITSGSSKKILVRCSKGHEFMRQLKIAVDRPDWCYDCLGRNPKSKHTVKELRGFSFESGFLFEKHPALETFYSKENRYSFKELPAKCFVVAKWSLDCGHSIRREVNYFLVSQKCPFCSNKKLLEGFNDLKTLNPGIVDYMADSSVDPKKILAGPTTLIRVICSICDKVMSYSAGSKNLPPICGNCSFSSRGEKELYNFIKEEFAHFEVVSNDRKVLNGKEIDIYLPSLKIGIEYNGIYWHRDDVVLSRTGLSSFEYHKNKYDSAKNNGVELVFVWENQWNDNQEEIKKLIKEGLLKKKFSSELKHFETPNNEGDSSPYYKASD